MRTARRLACRVCTLPPPPPHPPTPTPDPSLAGAARVVLTLTPTRTRSRTRTRARARAQVPPEWFCPLSRLLMLDPVCLMDGVSYNKAALEEWLQTKGSINPTTGAPLEEPVPRTLRAHALRLRLHAFTPHAHALHMRCTRAYSTPHTCLRKVELAPTSTPTLTVGRCCSSPTCCCTSRSARCSRHTRSCSSSPPPRAPRGAAAVVAEAGVVGAAPAACLQPERSAGRARRSPASGACMGRVRRPPRQLAGLALRAPAGR